MQTTDHARLEDLPPPAPNACRTIWIRHGETIWNKESRFQGHLDIPLSTTGIEQAQRLAQRWERFHAQAAHWRMAGLYSSDLSRAFDTATPLAQVMNLPLQTEPAIRERNYGICAGLTAAEMAVQRPEHYPILNQRLIDAELPEGETLQYFFDRVVGAASQLAERHHGQSIVLVAHGGVLDCVYRRAKQLPLNQKRGWLLLNTSINIVDIGPDTWEIMHWGDVKHLDTEARDEVDHRIV